MKKSIGIISASVIFLAFFLASCTTASEEVANAEENVIEAEEELEESNEAYRKEMRAYKERTAVQFDANEKSLKDFQLRIAEQKGEAKTDYEKKIAELNNKNSDLKRRMEDFRSDSQSSWEIFKSEFGRDMDELGKSFRDFTTNDDK